MSSEDKFELYEIIKAHQGVIDNKKTDASSASDKKNVWEEITRQYNSLGKFKRTTEQLKTCYKNAINVLKKDLAAEKADNFQTGGGTSTPKVNENHPLLSIVLPSVTPLRNIHDSSAEYFNVSIIRSLNLSI